MSSVIPEFLEDLPSGWRVIAVIVSHLGDDEPPFGLSYEDLLEDFVVLHSDRLQLAIEIDWLPERSPAGQFVLSAIDFSSPKMLVDSYARPQRRFSTRSLRRVTEEMRAWIQEFSR